MRGGFVADAGIVLPATLAARLGIEALVDEAVDLGDRPGAANAGAMVMTLIAAMALGADSIGDCDILRSGRTAVVLGHRVVAPSTLGTFLVRDASRKRPRSSPPSRTPSPRPTAGTLTLDRVLGETLRARLARGRRPRR